VGATNTINVSMQSGESLSEVVVQTFGYFFKDSRLSSSVSTVSADEIATTPALTIQNALQGQAAGVQVTGSNGPGAAAFVTVRGAKYYRWFSTSNLCS
jgi:outer membrane receptor for ferrienterochelin and colicin